MGYEICDGNKDGGLAAIFTHGCTLAGVPHGKHLVYDRTYEGDKPPKGIKVHELIEILTSDTVDPDAEVVVRDRDYGIDTPLLENIDGAIVIS